MSDDKVTTIISTPAGDIDASEVSSMPESERRFRDAWVLEGDVIAVDMDKAREIAREQIRAERAERFKAVDVEYLRLSETGGDPAAIIARKQALRDAPANPAIDEAGDDVELAAVVDEIVAGVKTC